MPTIERRAYVAQRQATHLLRTLGDEIREARLQGGVSQSVVAKASGVSRTKISRLERRELRSLTIVDLASAAGAVGLRVAARVYPAGAAVRDQAHIRLLDRFRARASPSTKWILEVPVGDDGRAWDAVIRCSDTHIAVEAETRVRDVQALIRRIESKRSESGVDAVVLLLADTRHNRAVIHEARQIVAGNLPVPARTVLSALGDGRAPPGGGIVFL